MLVTTVLFFFFGAATEAAAAKASATDYAADAVGSICVTLYPIVASMLDGAAAAVAPNAAAATAASWHGGASYRPTRTDGVPLAGE